MVVRVGYKPYSHEIVFWSKFLWHFISTVPSNLSWKVEATIVDFQVIVFFFSLRNKFQRSFHRKKYGNMIFSFYVLPWILWILVRPHIQPERKCTKYNYDQSHRIQDNLEIENKSSVQLAWFFRFHIHFLWKDKRGLNSHAHQNISTHL